MKNYHLFQYFPRLESDRLLLREWTEEDAPALERIIMDPAVYRYLPTFLYEQSDPDVRGMIANARRRCFDTGESILLGICLKSVPERARRHRRDL